MLSFIRFVFPVILLGACGSDPPPDPNPPAPVGTLLVKWRLQAEDGTEKTCAEVGVETMEVAIGGPSKEVPCSDGQVGFSDLLADTRYPIVARAQFQQATRATATANAVIEAAKETVVEVVFELEDVMSGDGEALIRWTIDGQSASRMCSAVNASRVRVLTLPGSLVEVDQEAPCAGGEALVTGLTAGPYAMALRLEDANGELIVSQQMQPFEVSAGLRAEPPAANFVTTTLDPTRLYAEWTINSSAAADACSTINGGRVTVFAIAPPPGRVTTSSTVDCEAGSALLQSTLDRGLYTVRLELIYDVVSETSTTVEVQLLRGETSSVSVDFRVE